MRRQDIRLLALARQGDAPARLEVGRRYLSGSDGFPRHVASGIEYLQHPSVAALPAVAQTVAECLRLDEIVQCGLLGLLQQAADDGLAVAQAKLGAWRLVRHAGTGAGVALLQAAARQGRAAAPEPAVPSALSSPPAHAAQGARIAPDALTPQAAQAARAMQVAHAAQAVLDAWHRAAAGPESDAGAALAGALQRLAAQRLLDAGPTAQAAARDALAAHDLQALGPALAAALALCGPGPGELADLVVEAVDAAEAAGHALPGLPAAVVEPLLEERATAGDRRAAHALGRALCGIDPGGLPARALATGPNMRKGAALLLRAADGGCVDAWMHLYRIHADHRLSVANPQMARFCLEKAATRGLAEAQRRLGALVLRGASTLHESEQALGWLHQAAQQGDDHAQSLLRSLVLPLEGDDDAAEAAIAAVSRHDPWLGARLRVAREFGLTKLEALCFEPVAGLRPWGLVVGKNPFISQIRLSAPRAIPAPTGAALAHLRAVAELFTRTGASASRHEGDLRRRSSTQRRLFARLGLDEAMFFAVASSVALDSFRLGTKWAFRAREPLRMALAA